MTRSALTLSLVLFLICLLGGQSGMSSTDDIMVEVSLNRDSIGLDEQAILEVDVSGSVQDLPPPHMPSLPMFEVYSQGRSSNISIVSGRVSSSVSYRYLMLPKKSGTFPIDQIAVVHNNKRYKGNSVKLTVLDRGVATSEELEERAVDSEGRSRDYFLEAIVDKKNPYVNEQVTLTLKFCIAVQHYGIPGLTEPTTTGFWIEVIGNKAPYFQHINNRRYKVIERKYALFPTQTGELTVGRATIRTTVAGRRKHSRDPFDVFGDFFGRGVEASARSKPVKINVRPLPKAGRPDDFTGTIGKFSISARADKHEVEVNQPVTVTISISGTGNIKSVAEPVTPELDDFRVYRASSNEKVSTVNDKLGGTKIFEEVFIPKRPGDLEIPAIGFTFFDPERGRYRSSSTRPIKLKVIKPEGYAALPDVPYAPPGLTIGSQASDVRHIKENLGQLKPIGRLVLLTPAYLVVNGLPVLVLVGTVLLRRRRERLADDIGYARSRSAAKVARKRLTRARSLANPDSVGEFYTEIYQALTSYIADKLNISPHGLTSERIAQLLTERRAGEDIVTGVLDIIKSCDYARFASVSLTQQDIDRSLAQVEKIIIRMEGVKFA